jgi:ribonuclease HII
MTAEKRDELYPAVLRAAARVSVVVRSARGIDSRGLHVTNIEALGTALERLRPGAEEAICLVDGFALRECAVPHRAVIEGDGTSAAIAAASVIAKVTRDRYMHAAGLQHPGWGFEEHVGYSTPEHREAIQRIGISPLHRRSFQSVAYSQLGLEGALDVLELDDAAVAVEGDADRVEANP